MPNHEAQVWIKTNKLLEASGWRLLDEYGQGASVQLETNVKIEDLGDDFEAVKDGFVDYLLFDDKGFPLAVLEANRADKNPLDGKEQAPKYAISQSELNLNRIRQSKQGGTWKNWNKHLLPNCYKKNSGKTYTSFYGRMHWDKVSPTITTQFTSYDSGRFGHPEQDRAISIREGALLQTFPKEYRFGDGEIDTVEISRHTGNAVQPELGLIIGKKIIKHLENIL